MSHQFNQGFARPEDDQFLREQSASTAQRPPTAHVPAEDAVVDSSRPYASKTGRRKMAAVLRKLHQDPLMEIDEASVASSGSGTSIATFVPYGKDVRGSHSPSKNAAQGSVQHQQNRSDRETDPDDTTREVSHSKFNATIFFTQQQASKLKEDIARLVCSVLRCVSSG